MYIVGISVNNEFLYVIDTGNQRIQVFSTEGEYMSSFGSSGLGPGQFLNSVGIDMDSEGNIYVTNKGNGKIEKFNTDGELIKSFSFYFPRYVFSPETISIDPLDDMFVVNSVTGRILHLLQNSDLRLEQSDQSGPYHNSFEHLTDMEMGVNGELLVIDSPTHSIQSFETMSFEQSPEFYFDVPDEVHPPFKDQIKPEIIARFH